MHTKQKSKKSNLQLMLEAKLESVGMTCFPSDVLLRSMHVFVIKFEQAEDPIEVLLPNHEVAYRVAYRDHPQALTEEAVRNYDVPIIDVVAYALAFYWSMPSSVKDLLRTLGEISTLRIKAIAHMERLYDIQ